MVGYGEEEEKRLDRLANPSLPDKVFEVGLRDEAKRWSTVWTL